MIYCFDASAWIDCWVRWYPQTTFPSLWNNFDELINNGQIVTPAMIADELALKSDGMVAWLKQRDHCIHDPDERVQIEVRKIMGRFRNFVEMRGKSGGDPWVVATALVVKGVVVTGERRSGAADKPRIPNVCDALNLQSMSTIEFICHHGWKF